MEKVERRGFKANAIAPLPADGPVLSFPHDLCGYLRMTASALQKVVDAGDNELGEFLRKNLRAITPKKRYVSRAALLDWLRAKTSVAS